MMQWEKGLNITSYFIPVLGYTVTGYTYRTPFDPSGSNVIEIITVSVGTCLGYEFGKKTLQT